jgi:DNA polymerase III subunit epsilon
MRPDKIVFIDTETGGLDPMQNSLLSIALVIWQEFEIIDSTEILIDDGVLNVSKKALEINKIDLVEHKAKALVATDAINKVDEFFSKHFGSEEKITLGGHNINFDVNFLRHFLVRHNYQWHKRFSHRFVDTATILYYLYLSGKLKEKAISSDEAFRLFGINVDNRHSALGDAVATAKLFTTLLKIIYKNAPLASKPPSLELFTE